MKTHILYFWIAILGGMLFGYDTAVINGAMPFFTSHFELSDAMVGWSVSSGLLGCIIGATIASWPADKWGRRDTMKMAALMFLISALGTGLAYDFTMFVIARIIGGIAVGVVSVTMPIYLSEITPPEKRGSSTINFQLGVVVGILAAFFVDYLLIDTGEHNWRYMFLSMAIPSGFFFLFLLKAQRSPRWLVQQRYLQEAKEVLSGYNSAETSRRLILEIQTSLHKQNVNQQIRIPLFKKPNLRFMLIGIAVGVFSQLSGIAIVMYYATDIFRAAGFSTDAAIGQTVIIGLTNLTFTLLAKFLIDKLGRRKLLLFGTAGMSIVLAVLALSYFNTGFPAWILLVSLVSFVALFASSMGAVSWVLLGEIFPNSIRSQGMSIGSLSNWIVNGGISFLFPIATGALPNGGGYCFAFFSVTTLAGYFFFKKYLFETRNKSLEEIEKENS
ncbi:sugar porter family MFS transporter [Parabacteroides faecis]|uniref:sugar porter family MFS transporter n=1 Tax=Parabacteroides faecis TaxID=1217282 RepID=UPI002164E01B|nr:sugar porter family MFS transporter [Parabacteroides faecis]MCS2891674.1 sugar porter family MFS transporter [Parabacteroides faecis]UVQ44710.1 sugar porter family MFS transporter [Parabacteroides faecis]